MTGNPTGHFVEQAPFMVLRSRRPDRRPLREPVDENVPDRRTGCTAVNPRVVAYRHQGWRLALGHLVPELRYAMHEAA
ncbi:hypothetical protein [Nocardiopsis lambiniae]|uniref:Uncharacterized protein n=1 Tax=Nocardiopsis lambiniae TaxID=3075539 RepID=A0ABU2M709_9ACTN|nr:hypothetical protein [Nocardiopsis sp. DSM 44743]MDT0327771.1 hypothetical protein [Nocardiopsis sp. DSM 44743]